MVGVGATNQSNTGDSGYEFGSAHLLADEELFAAVSTLERARRHADACLAEVTAEVAVRGASDREWGLTAANWLAREAGLPGPQARRRAALSTKLADWLPDVHTALAEGRISWAHAEVILDGTNDRNRHAVAACAHLFITDAESGATFEVWRIATIDQMKTLDQDGAFDPEELDREPRDHVHVRQHRDGSVTFKGTFHGENAAVVEEMLGNAREKARQRHERDIEHLQLPRFEMPGHGQLMAEGFIDLCVQAAGAMGVPSITLRIAADDPTVAVAKTGQRLSGPTLDALLDADSWFRPLVADSRGVPLWLGTAVRFATPDQREAALNRQGGSCAIPGCIASEEFLQIHHVHPFGLGGPTDLPYLVPLCRHHHRGVIHRRGWVMWPEFDADDQHAHAQPTGEHIIQTPSGRRMYAQRGGRQPDHPPAEGPPPPWVQRVIARRH